MRLIIQRVSQAQVTIDQQIIGAIDRGFMVLVGVEEEDTQEDVDYLIRKVSKMRIFDDEDGKMNLSLDQVGGAVLSVSQFTLHADTRKGNRPSFVRAARPDLGEKLYKSFNEGLKANGIPVETGEFGGDMEVTLTNDGPVTIFMDSKDK